MRVRKKCNKCRKLKSRLDFPVDDSSEKRGVICSLCISGREDEYQELNSKINKNPLNLKTMSLKEKRAAAAAAAKTTPEAKKPVVKKETVPVAKKETAPVAKKEAAKKEATSTAKKETAPVVKKEAKVKPTVSQIDLATGKVIKVHENIDAAAAAVGKHKKYIDICAKNGSKSAYGFNWLYEGLELEEVPVKKAAKVADKPVPGDLDYDAEEEEETGEEDFVDEEEFEEEEFEDEEE